MLAYNPTHVCYGNRTTIYSTTAQIAADTRVSTHIAAGTRVSRQIAAGTMVSTEIAAGTRVSTQMMQLVPGSWHIRAAQLVPGFQHIRDGEWPEHFFHWHVVVSIGNHKQWIADGERRWIIMIPGQFIKHHKWRFDPHQEHFHIWTMIDWESSKLDHGYQCHITLACKAATNYTSIAI